MKINILKPKENSCEYGDVRITDPYGQGSGCEHCGELQPFQASISDGNTYWCFDCAEGIFDEDGEEITKGNLKEVRDEVKIREKEYIGKRHEKLFGKTYTAEQVMKKFDSFSDAAPLSYIKREFEKFLGLL